jgi:hypothetical protein
VASSPAKSTATPPVPEISTIREELMSINPTANPRHHDVALAARLVAAVSAEDQPGWSAVIAEVRHSGRMEELALALAVQAATLAEQATLDARAFDANGALSGQGDR